jgi:hypothetical protein
MPDSLEIPPTVAPSTDVPPARPALRGWRKILFVVAIVAVSLRLVMFLFLHFPTRHAAKIPAWPLHAGDVLPLTPGDPNIAKWAENPSTDGFVVQQLESDGQPIIGSKVCALEPDYMADSQQPGGALTLLDQQPTGDWRVSWSGGDTLPPFLKKSENFDANCGRRAVVVLSTDQLHAFLDILNGVSIVVPPATAQTPASMP